jgi:hypothetical protein
MSRSLSGAGLRQVRRYIASSLWILRDGLQGAGSRVALVVVSDVLGVTLAAASIAVVLLYARAAEQGEALTVLGRTIAPLSDWPIPIVAAVALAGGLLSAASLFCSELVTHQLARRYQRVCIGRVLRAAARDDSGRLLDELAARSGQRVALATLATATSKYCAFALRSQVRALLPALYTVVAAAALVRIDWRTTLALTGLAAFYFVPLVMINRRVAAQHRRYREVAPGVQSGLRRAIQALQSTGGAVRDERTWRPAVLEDPGLDAMQDALYGRQLASKKVAMLNGMFFVICLFAILVAVTLRGDDRAISWTALLAYVVALRVTWTGIRQMTAALVTVNRFFHEYDLYAAFTAAVDAISGAPAGQPLEDAIEITPEAGDPVRIGPGDVLLALDGGAGDRSGVERVGAALLAGTSIRRRIEDGPRPLEGATVSEHLAGPEEEHAALEAARDRLRRLGVLEELEALPEGLATVLDAPTLARLSADARLAVATGGAVGAAPGVNVQSLRGWRGLSPRFQRRRLRALARDAVVLVDDSTEGILHSKLEPLRRAVGRVLLVDGDRVVESGTMAWLEEHGEAVTARLAAARPAPAGAGALDDQDLDDDDDV